MKHLLSALIVLNLLTLDALAMDKILFQFYSRNEKPTLESVRDRFGFLEEELDREYGVIEIDTRAGLFSVLVDAEAQPRLESSLKDTLSDPAEGFFANPTIEPFGPPER